MGTIAENSSPSNLFHWKIKLNASMKSFYFLFNQQFFHQIRSVTKHFLLLLLFVQRTTIFREGGYLHACVLSLRFPTSSPCLSGRNACRHTRESTLRVKWRVSRFQVRKPVPALSFCLYLTPLFPTTFLFSLSLSLSYLPLFIENSPLCIIFMPLCVLCVWDGPGAKV